MIKRKNEIMTIGDAKKLYILEKKAKGCVESTIDNTEFIFYLFLRDNTLTEEDPLHFINKNIVNEWSLFLQSQEISPESVNAYLSRLRAFINWCIANEYLPYFKVNLIKAQEQNIKFFNEEELEILCRKPAKDCTFIEYRTWVIICFILSTGARASTIVNIYTEDIQDKKVYYRHLKNKSIAYIPLNDKIFTILNNYTKLWDTQSDYLFCDYRGNQLTVSALRQSLKKYCKDRGVSPRGPHALRHSFAREWIKGGGGAFQLQTLLCHKDGQMTKKYVDLFSEDLIKDVEEFSPLENFVKNNKKVMKRA